jgi:hypothetical protein
MYFISCFGGSECTGDDFLFPVKQQEHRSSNKISQVLEEHVEEVKAMGYGYHRLVPHTLLPCQVNFSFYKFLHAFFTNFCFISLQVDHQLLRVV